MVHKDLGNVNDLLKKMVQLELVMAELYRTCGQILVSDKDFWTDLEKAEAHHAENIHLMSKIISEMPTSFELGRPVKPAAIQTSIAGVQWNIQRLKKKELSEKNMLFIARDLEQSTLESNYGEIVKTNDIEYKNLINQILSETAVHRDRLNKKIQEIAP